jgi:hypothetical protein
MSKPDEFSKAQFFRAQFFRADEFRQYAAEALRAAAESSSDQEKQALIKLARTWSQAAMRAQSLASSAIDADTLAVLTSP